MPFLVMQMLIKFLILQTLEDEFSRQLEEHERFYGPYLKPALSAEAGATVSTPTSSSSRRTSSSATPAQNYSIPPSSFGRRGLTVDRKPSSKSSGSDHSVGSGSRKSSSFESHHHSTPTSATNNVAVKRLSASRHSLASKGGSDVWPF